MISRFEHIIAKNIRELPGHFSPTEKPYNSSTPFALNICCSPCSPGRSRYCNGDTTRCHSLVDVPRHCIIDMPPVRQKVERSLEDMECKRRWCLCRLDTVPWLQKCDCFNITKFDCHLASAIPWVGGGDHHPCDQTKTNWWSFPRKNLTLESWQAFPKRIPKKASKNMESRKPWWFVDAFPNV